MADPQQSNTQPIRFSGTEAPETDVVADVKTESPTDHPWRVVLFNDEVHTFEEVIIQLIKATRCTTQRALELTMEVHYKGQAIVFDGSFERCFQVEGVLKEIQLITEIRG